MEQFLVYMLLKKSRQRIYSVLHLCKKEGEIKIYIYRYIIPIYIPIYINIFLAVFLRSLEEMTP